jgi:hypothetical protein
MIVGEQHVVSLDGATPSVVVECVNVTQNYFNLAQVIEDAHQDAAGNQVPRTLGNLLSLNPATLTPEFVLPNQQTGGYDQQKAQWTQSGSDWIVCKPSWPALVAAGSLSYR